jgi:5-formyltetrahydrofolate cyclo-ligase
MTQARAAISADQALAVGQAIADRLEVWPSWRSSAVVALFATLSGEVDTRPLVELARRDGKRILFPRMLEGRTLEFAVAEEIGSLRPGRYGVLEPDHQSQVETLTGNAIVFVPGVAFDREGGRLGRGAGYYDRALGALAGRSRRPQFVGVGFESQIVSSVPMDSLDLRLDVVVTEAGIFVADGTGVNREVG